MIGGRFCADPPLKSSGWRFFPQSIAAKKITLAEGGAFG